MKVQYVGPDIGVDGLKDGNVYQVLGVDELSGMLRIVDESGEDYLYHPTQPKALADSYKGGKFLIVEDDKNGSLKEAISFN